MVAATPIMVEVEHTCIGSVVVIAPTYEERIAQVRKVRVVTVLSLILSTRILHLEPFYHYYRKKGYKAKGIF